MENPAESDLALVHIIDPPPFPFSSENIMQADELKNRSSLHSIWDSAFRTRGSLSKHKKGHFVLSGFRLTPVGVYP